MKYLLMVLGMLTGTGLSAQQLIEVGWDKTTFLVFDAAIESVDRGSRVLLTQRDETGLNLLKLKAGSRDFGMTNLHVLTADGTLHDFTISYADSPAESTVDLRTSDHLPGKQALMKSNLTSADFEAINKNLGFGDILKREANYQMELVLDGLYYHNGLLFFHFILANHTVIPFELSRVESKVKDKKSGRRSSNRSVPLTPVYNSGDDKTALSHGKYQSLMMVFEVFTIAEKKELEFSFYELHGDRQLDITISGKKLLKAEDLPISNLNQTNDGSGEF